MVSMPRVFANLDNVTIGANQQLNVVLSIRSKGKEKEKGKEEENGKWELKLFQKRE